MSRVARNAIAVVLALLPLLLNLQYAAAGERKVPLDYRAYDGWNAIRGTVLSNDGRYAAYAVVPQDGDPTLVVHDFGTGNDVRETRGIDPTFSADSRYVVYTQRAANAEIHKADREHKKPADQPKNGIGILDLATTKVIIVERVKSFKVAPDIGTDTLAYSVESPQPAPSSVTPTVRPAPTHGAVAVPSPSPSPSVDDLHKKDTGTLLVVRNLASQLETRFTNVTAYALSHDGAYVGYAQESIDGKTDAVSLLTLQSGTSSDALRGPGHYKDLAFAPHRNLFAFVSDAATFSSAGPQYALYQSDLSGTAGTARARVLVSGATAGFASAPPSENGVLRYSKDGARLFFGVAAVPTPAPSGTPDPVKVDIWNWQDLDLQSVQRKRAEDERKRTFTAVAATDGTRARQLAGGNLRSLVINENANVVLGIDDVRYRKAQSWDLDYNAIFAVSLSDGSRRQLIAKQRDDDESLAAGDRSDDPILSPRGNFVVAYDAEQRAWFSVDTRSGARVDLTSRLKPAFYDELDDHPAAPPPYGLAGWVDGDRYVLLRDRYDVWAVEPRTGAAHNLTGGIGRRQHIIFIPQQHDPDADSYDVAKPIVLDATNDDTKAHGIWRVRASGATAFAPQPVFMLPKAVTFVTKARSADRIVIFEQTFSEMRNLWSAASLDAPFARVSDANPQRAAYLWGNEQLVTYRSTWGVPLRGILFTPENFDRRKHYPLLVYFYERFSNLFHQMPFTTPAPNTSPTLIRYVSNGYAVFVPDVAYRVGHPGESALDCILPGIDSLVQRGFIDSARIGIAGHSWAAYQIAYMLTRTNRFRAAEAGAAVANMTSAYGGIRLESGRVREFQYERSQSRIGATPWDRTDLYIENSALFHVANVNTPYLTIANDLDGAVPQLQGIEFFTALRRLGKEAYLFAFDGEDHNLKGREQQKYWTVHLDEFFDRFLLGKAPPDWMTHGVNFLQRGQRDVDASRYGEKF